MEKGRKLITLFATLIFGITLLVAPAPADAKVKIYDKDGAVLKLGFRIQSRLQMLNEYDTADAGSRDYNMDFRRMRIAGSGKLNDMVSFAAQTDIAGGTAQAGVGDDGVEWRDAVITLKFSPGMNLSFGLFTIQFTRSRTSSGFGQMVLDRTFVEGIVTDTSDVDESIGGKRDQQIVLWGDADKIHYSVGLGDGATTVTGENDTLRMTVRAHYAIWDQEKGLGTKETYLGKKKIMTVGFGYDTQANVNGAAGSAKANTAMTLDFSYENPMDGGGVPNFNAAYSTRDVDDDTSASQGTGLHAAVGYLMPGGKIQPYLRYATWDAKPTGADVSHTNIGLNYFLKGHKAKIVFDYDMVDHETEGTVKADKNHGVMTMQWQLDF